MEKTQSRDKKRRTQSPSRISKVVAVIALALICIVGTSMFAQVSSRKKAKTSSELSVMNLTPATPSKEYIYAGSKLVATEEAISFADVDQNTPFRDDIIKIARRKVTLGCGGNALGQAIFCPDAPVTREQMAAFIMRALGEFNPPTPQTQRFTDVPSSNGFYNFIDRMAVLQITLGCGTGIYCPSDNVPHEQMAAFIMRAKAEFNPTPPTFQRFSDVLIPPSNPYNGYYAFIDRMYVLNIWQGCSTSPLSYCPSTNVTRAQMAHILVQAFGANWQ